MTSYSFLPTGRCFRARPSTWWLWRPLRQVGGDQRKGADDAIEGAFLEEESFAAQHPLVNLDACLLDAPSCPAVHPDVRINGRDLANVGRVVWQVQAGAEADFQNVAACVGEQF